MNLFSETLAWLSDPANWAGPSGIPTRLGQHLAITAIAVLLAAVISLPAGVLIGHTRRGAGFVGGLTGAARALPTLGVLTLLGLAFGIGLAAPLLALIVLAIPSLLAGAYAGVQSVDPTLPSAARAIGLSPTQVILRVEVPLALPILVGGIRAATLQVVSTATLAAYTADFGLGRYLFAGLKTRDYPQMLGGTILVIALTLALDVVLACCQRAAQRVRDPGGTSGSKKLSDATNHDRTNTVQHLHLRRKGSTP
ncbi:ABC transporter permease [Leucobacter viscericola]|uniref:ABC transporter permease n=1 Tax=Leucobacter viscericola TaxID=2714935 RepID=A0A6G7XI97_9MICO|nr:ABC transporter permease [Leucobacter viscericola]QIK64330.1 ABC transporter permease [Leucobacter viscericola]